LLTAARSVADVTVHDLYDAYSDFDIDVAREQALLLAHDIIVWQHPFYWYSTPPLVKQWGDLVLVHGWACQRDGTALHGKRWLHAVSTGGSEQAYQHNGNNRFTIRELLAPLEQTARLCGMRWLAPFVVHGTHVLVDDAFVEAAHDHARVLTALRDGVLDEDAAAELPRLNANVAALLRQV